MPYKDNLIAREDNVFLNDVLCQIDQSISQTMATRQMYSTYGICLGLARLSSVMAKKGMQKYQSDQRLYIV